MTWRGCAGRRGPWLPTDVLSVTALYVCVTPEIIATRNGREPRIDREQQIPTALLEQRSIDMLTERALDSLSKVPCHPHAPSRSRAATMACTAARYQ